MSKKLPTKAYQQSLVDKLVSSFKKNGYKFTCSASFDVMEGYARELCTEAFKNGYCFSKSNFFPFENSIQVLLVRGARQYYEEEYLGR